MRWTSPSDNVLTLVVAGVIVLMLALGIEMFQRWRELNEQRSAMLHAAKVAACFEVGGELLYVVSGAIHVETCTRDGHPVAWRAPQ